MSATVLDVLLIEDNPGDARLIEEMFEDSKAVFQRIDVDTSSVDRVELYHEERLSTGIGQLSESDIDVVLLDLGLPDSTGLDTLAAVLDATEFVPVVVFTGLSDEGVGIEAIQRGAQDYLVKHEVTADLLVRTIHYAIERNRQERKQSRQLEQLEALNRLNRISQDITHAVITSSRRDELERAVCERLVESDAYAFAWIGEIDRVTDELSPRVAAGVDDGYLDDIVVPVDDEVTTQGPGGKAVREQEVQVVQDVQTSPSFEPWREQAEERGFRSIAAVPIVHENLIYGVLGVYATSANAFSEPEIEILSRLGHVIGHAITAIDRKDALVSDTVLELEFTVAGIVEELVSLSAERGGSVEFEQFIQGRDVVITYGRTAGIPPEELRDVAERTDSIDDIRVFSATGDACEFELVTGAVDALVEAVATHGGQFESATVTNGEFRFVVAFPPGRDKRQLVELVAEHCAAATPHAQRTVQRRDRDRWDSNSILRDRLTEKQRIALKMAYYAGFFEWPRRSTGQEVADRLGITPATLTQHLRAAEREFFDAVFEDGESADHDTSSDWMPLESDFEAG